VCVDRGSGGERKRDDGDGSRAGFGALGGCSGGAWTWTWQIRSHALAVVSKNQNSKWSSSSQIRRVITELAALVFFFLLAKTCQNRGGFVMNNSFKQAESACPVLGDRVIRQLLGLCFS